MGTYLLYDLCLMKGGENMSYVISLLKEAAAVAVNAGAFYLAQYLITRLKGKTAPTANRDGSDILN